VLCKSDLAELVTDQTAMQNERRLRARRYKRELESALEIKKNLITTQISETGVIKMKKKNRKERA